MQLARVYYPKRTDQFNLTFDRPSSNLPMASMTTPQSDGWLEVTKLNFDEHFGYACSVIVDSDQSTDENLENVFHQMNMFESVDKDQVIQNYEKNSLKYVSMSIGSIVQLDDTYYMTAPIGFAKIDSDGNVDLEHADLNIKFN